MWWVFLDTNIDMLVFEMNQIIIIKSQCFYVIPNFPVLRLVLYYLEIVWRLERRPKALFWPPRAKHTQLKRKKKVILEGCPKLKRSFENLQSL